MEKNKNPEVQYEELKKAILEVKYEPSMKIDRPLEKLEQIRQSITHLFSYPHEHNTLYEYYYKQKQEIITDCLKHLLLKRKDRLKKLQIEYVITSIFDYIFNFNLEKALTSIYGPNFRDVIEHPNKKNNIYLFCMGENKMNFANGKIENSLILECEIDDCNIGNTPVLSFNVVKNEIVKDKRIILMKSKSIYLLDVCDKEEDANFILLNTSPNARYYRSEEDALYFFERFKKDLAKEESKC